MEMAAVLIACGGVCGRLAVPEAAQGVTAYALVVDSIERPTSAPEYDWQGYEAWLEGLGAMVPGEIIDLGKDVDGWHVVEISGLRFQRAMIGVVRDAYPSAAWSAGHDLGGRPVARAEQDGRTVGLVMGLWDSMRCFVTSRSISKPAPRAPAEGSPMRCTRCERPLAYHQCEEYQCSFCGGLAERAGAATEGCPAHRRTSEV